MRNINKAALILMVLGSMLAVSGCYYDEVEYDTYTAPARVHYGPPAPVVVPTSGGVHYGPAVSDNVPANGRVHYGPTSAAPQSGVHYGAPDNSAKADASSGGVHYGKKLPEQTAEGGVHYGAPMPEQGGVHYGEPA